MNVNLSEDEIRDAVRAVVDEEMPDAVRVAVLSHAGTLIKDAVAARIGPVIDEMLSNEQFVTGRYDDVKTPLDRLVKGAVSKYLDERVFLYSKTDDRPSVRFSASAGNSGQPTRLEAFLRFTVERFCDEHLATKLEPTVKAFIEQRGGIESVAREQMAALLKEKFKL
jgi:hypothetical protein